MNPRIPTHGLRAGLLGAVLLLGGCAELNSQLNSMLGKNDPPRTRARVDDRSHPRAERAERNERPAPRPERPAPDRAAANRALPATSGATYKLVIKPWGMVQVNGVDYGASPPLKRLTLAPGQHTIRIVNPHFPEHTVIVNSVKGATAVIEMDFTEEEVE